jgi:hypothetical protein
MDNDNGLRDAARSFVLHLRGEAINEIGKKVEAAGAVQVGGCTVLPGDSGGFSSLISSIIPFWKQFRVWLNKLTVNINTTG